MNVADLMTRAVATCTMTDTLEHVARMMWERDCGCIPVVDAERHVVGMVTDRDVCMAALRRALPLDVMSVSTTATTAISCVSPNTTVETAETVMRHNQVRRLPVTDGDGVLLGIISMIDLARHVQGRARQSDGLSGDAITRTLAAICRPPPAFEPEVDVDRGG